MTQEEKDDWKEREEKEKERRKKHRGWRTVGGSGGGVGGFINIVFLIIVLVQGAWMTPFNALPFTYWVYAYLWAILLTGLICGIPVLIGGLWYLKRELDKIDVDTPSKVKEAPKTEE